MAAVRQKQLNRLVASFFLGLTLVLALAALGIWRGYRFAAQQVSNQLTQEKIYFPAKGSAALNPAEFPGLQQYAGQPVDTGPKAKAYADEFIWVHMMKSSGSKTYAEVSNEAQANPKDQKLAALKNTLFQGDMLRSSLLTAYAFSVFGMIAGIAAKVSAAASAAALIAALLLLARAARQRG